MKLSSILLVLAVVAGCGKKGDNDSSAGGKVASCLMEAVHNCREYRGDNLLMGTESLQELCTTVVSSAKFTETACPTEKVIATCAMPTGKDFYYEGASTPVERIEASCKEMGGTFAKK